MITITYKFEHWLPGLLKVDAITLGRTIYFRKNTIGTGFFKLFTHEMIHVFQIMYFNNKSFLRFLYRYTMQWISCGFKYSNIKYEVDARSCSVSPNEIYRIFGQEKGLLVINRCYSIYTEFHERRETIYEYVNLPRKQITTTFTI